MTSSTAFSDVKKKYWALVAAAAMLLGGSGGGYWWVAHQQKPTTASAKLVLRHNSTWSFPDTVVSVPGADGFSSYLVLGVCLHIKTANHLSKAWMSRHKALVHAALLSALLDFKGLGKLEKRSALRAQLRADIAAKVRKVISAHPQDAEVRVYITKLIEGA